MLIKELTMRAETGYRSAEMERPGAQRERHLARLLVRRPVRQPR